MSESLKYKVEYARSNRSACKKCKRNIGESSIRVAKMVQFSRADLKVPLWHHLRCAKTSKMFKELTSCSELVGFANLKWEDQEKLGEWIDTKDLGKTKQPKKKRRKLSHTETRHDLRLQAETYSSYISELKKLSSDELRKMLEANGYSSSGPLRVLHEKCADGMLCGALSPCPVCSSQDIRLEATSYKCHGYSSSWAKCPWMSDDPKRVHWIIPESLKESHEFLKNYTQIIIQRILPKPKPSGRVTRQSVKMQKGEVEEKNVGKRYAVRGSDVDDSVLVKGLAAVDTHYPFHEKYHVVQEDEEVWSTVLTLTDVITGKNSFYILQLLQKDTVGDDSLILWKRWGRTGTRIGDSRWLRYLDLESAKDAFSSLFLKKTGNEWVNRCNCVKHPGRFFPLELDFGDLPESSGVAAGSKTTLPSNIQNLLMLIFDVEEANHVLREMKIDMTKMPLGNLSASRIQEGFSLLKSIQDALEAKLSEESKKATLLDLSNRFCMSSSVRYMLFSLTYYTDTLIPHVLDRRTISIIDNDENIAQKTSMLEELSDMEIMMTMLNEDRQSDEDPIDFYHRQLGCRIENCDDDHMRGIIAKYVENTHERTHSYGLTVVDVFTIERTGENDRFERHKNEKNHFLLWHGSRTTNYAGILSQGLRIAPPEAPSNGFMFGKGVYFASSVSKSANYCNASRNGGTGLLLLCEVALGEMCEVKNAESMSNPPEGFKSTKGLGKSCPNMEESETIDDVRLPISICEKDLTAYPEFAGLLATLADSKLDEYGNPLDDMAELKEQRLLLDREKRRYFENKVILHQLHEVLNDDDDNSIDKKTKEALNRLYSAGCARQYVSSDRSETLLGLTPDDISSVVDKKESDVSVVCGVLDDQLIKLSEAISGFYDPNESSSSSPLSTDISALVRELKQKIELQRQKLRAVSYTIDQTYAELHIVLLESVHMLHTIARQYTLSSSARTVETQVRWLVATVATMRLKLSLLKYQFLAETYTSEKVAALHRIQEIIEGEISEAEKELNIVQDRVAAYDDAGEQFGDLVAEYTRLREAIEHKKWAIREIQNSKGI